ncbi:20705_t:CDS:2, partial [Gigaspora margarita]
KREFGQSLSSTVWYYDTKLEWVNRRGFLKQKIQEAEVYTEPDDIKEPKSVEESKFGRKKDKEKITILNRLQKNPNDMTNNNILKEILQRLENIERRHIGAIALNRF